MRKMSIVVLSIVVLFAFLGHAQPVQALDAVCPMVTPATNPSWNWLLKWWDGDWKPKTTGRGNKVYFSVCKIDEATGQFDAVIHMIVPNGMAYHNKDIPIKGVVEGPKGAETITMWYSSVWRSEVTRQGDKLVGWGMGGKMSDVVYK